MFAFSLKRFFSSKLKSQSGSVSSDSVKGQIKNLVEEEDRSKPLTDTDIAANLQDKGVKISRRTVTKYRENLGIMPASVRRQ